MSSTYSSKVYRGPEGRKLSAKDVAERLLPDLSMNELLCWAPDLFAYTSYLMSITGAYQLVVSPPKGKNWQPTNEEILRWIGIKYDKKDVFVNDCLQKNIEDWLKNFIRESINQEVDYEALKPEEKEMWGLNTETWSPYENTDYFNEEFINSVAEKPSIENKIRTIAIHIRNHAIKSLKSGEKGAIKLKVDDIHDKYLDSSSDTFEEDVYTEKIVVDKDGNEEKKQERTKIKKICLGDLLRHKEKENWIQFVQGLGDAWNERLSRIEPVEFYIINDAELNENGDPIFDKSGSFVQWDKASLKGFSLRERYSVKDGHKLKEEDLLGILLKYTPPLLISCWAFFYNEVNKIQPNGFELPISKLLCNRDDLQLSRNCSELWEISQSLITMHAVADICCTGWGIKNVQEIGNEKDGIDGRRKKVNEAQWFAERLLFDKGSLSTINPGRGRILPKRHNPGVGITLRSISSNLGFHRSSIDVVWRKTKQTALEKQVKEKGNTFSVLLFPHPVDIRAKDFPEDDHAENRVNFDKKDYGFFGYAPTIKIDNERIISLIKRAKEELNSKENRVVDAIVFPETALSKSEYESLEKDMQNEFKEKSPSLFIAGVRESRKDVYLELHKSDEAVNEYQQYYNDKNEELKQLKKSSNVDNSYDIANLEKLIRELDERYKEESINNINFARNAVYCKYYDLSPDDDGVNPLGYCGKKGEQKSFSRDLTPKYKQYKHHRWRLDSSQIIRYGLSQALDNTKIWWEAIKIPRRRVSFLNIGNKITISTLVCEDLARQDPIADLIRHVGPSLVITLLMDGPQVKSRWSGRYASILSDDPGCSVITLTSLGMVKRDTSFGLSRIIGLWSQSHGERVQEIGLAEGAEAVLLILKLDEEKEKTADGRQEREATTVIKLLDMIQVYPDTT